jgi:hypothetical protein
MEGGDPTGCQPGPVEGKFDVGLQPAFCPVAIHKSHLWAFGGVGGRFQRNAPKPRMSPVEKALSPFHNRRPDMGEKQKAG